MQLFTKNDILTVDEVSAWLRIPKSTLYKLCSKGQIPCTKIGKHWRFEKSIIEDWFEEKVTKSLQENRPCKT